jgi:hypothetical protein
MLANIRVITTVLDGADVFATRDESCPIVRADPSITARD